MTDSAVSFEAFYVSAVVQPVWLGLPELLGEGSPEAMQQRTVVDC